MPTIIKVKVISTPINGKVSSDKDIIKSLRSNAKPLTLIQF